MVQTSLFFVYFKSFYSKNTILQQIRQCEICPSSIRRWDSISRPCDYESPPLTTRIGLPFVDIHQAIHQ